LTELGADVDATFGAVGLTRADLADPEGLIPYAQLERLLIECEQRTGCDHFALLMSQDVRLDDFGLTGRVVRCAATVGDGLSALVRLYNLRRGGGLLHLVSSENPAQLVFSMAAPGTLDTHRYQMGAMVIVFNVLRDLCGHDWQPSEVRFAFRSPHNVQPFLRFFRTPVHFDAVESAVLFHREWLDRRLPPVDQAFRLAVADEERRAHRQAYEDLPGLVRDMIRKQLSYGPCSSIRVAAALSMHRRTLHRRLVESGETFREVKRAVECEIAQQLLRETDLPVQRIADFLHFSSTANFATAFLQWTGNTPTEYRAKES